MRQLRDYQAEAVDAVRADWAAGVLRPAVVHATGMGKTSIIGKLCTDEAAAGGRVLVLAHRGKLLNQITEACRAFRPDIPVGRVQASTDQRGYPITVAMTPTLANAPRRNRMPRPTLVVYDECHHAPAASSLAILEWAGSFESTRTVGVTATLVRGDKRKPSMVWQKVSHERDIEWGVTHGPDPADPYRSIEREFGEGWLVPPRGRCVVVDHLDLTKVATSRGDYVQGELGEMISQDVDQIAKAWLEHAADRTTVAFWPTVAAATAARDEWLALGVPAGLVTGTQSEAEQERVYRALDTDKIRILHSVMVPTEGFDCARVSCVIVARPTKLKGLLVQMIGRGTRPFPNKRECLILDPVGATRGQTLVNVTDLSPMFERDTSEVEALPCESCGGYRPTALRADPSLPACTCERGPAPEKPDNRLQGPARYVDIDLVRRPGVHRWLRTRSGVPFLIVGDRAAVLYADTCRPDSPTWTPGHIAVRGREDAVQLDPGAVHTFEQARVVAERWAGPCRTRGRKPGPPDERAVGKARAFGIANPERMDRNDLEDTIAVARVSLRVDR